MAKILIVDDSPTMRVTSTNILQKYGFDVIQAENGRQALDLLHQESPDVILLDVIMPQMDGYETLALIRKHEDYKTIPVIMITVKYENEDIVKGLNMGADDYLSKPFVKEELVARINAMLRTKELHDRLLEQNEELLEINNKLKSANKKINDQEKVALLGQFMIGIHHELRNPLTAALSNSQILLKYFELSEDKYRFVSDIEGQLQDMTRILNDIKEMDRVSLQEYVKGMKMVSIRKPGGNDNIE